MQLTVVFNCISIMANGIEKFYMVVIWKFWKESVQVFWPFIVLYAYFLLILGSICIFLIQAHFCCFSLFYVLLLSSNTPWLVFFLFKIVYFNKQTFLNWMRFYLLYHSFILWLVLFSSHLRNICICQIMWYSPLLHSKIFIFYIYCHNPHRKFFCACFYDVR